VNNQNETVSRTNIKFVVDDIGEAKGEFIRFLTPITIERITKNLPIEGRATIWKEEVYFEIPIKMGLEKAKGKVEKGDIAYWPMGSAICIFYGETQPYSPVNILGKITENLELFRQVKSGTIIKIERENII